MPIRNGDNIEVRNGSRQTSIPALNASEPRTFQSVGVPSVVSVTMLNSEAKLCRCSCGAHGVCS